MAKQGKKPAKKPSAKTGRVRKLTKKQARAKAKKEAKKINKLPGAFRLTGRSAVAAARYWRPLGGIVLVYLVLNIVFASGISNVNSDFSSIKADLDTAGGHNIWQAAGGFGSLVASAGASGSATGSALQSVLFVLESLVIIWALRHLLAGQAVAVKLAWYRAMSPLVPFLLVIFMIVIQLLPLTVGALVLGVVATSVFAGSGAATALAAAALVLLGAWSLYMVSSSIFALYIVTLPDTQPRQALRAAKELVRFRRLSVIRKVLFLPIVVVLVMAVIVVPLIVWASGVVPWIFFVLSMLAILFVHTYLYNLYRGLLE